MKKILLAAIALLVTAVAALAAGPRNISSAEAKSLMSKKHNVYLLDVRTPEEYRQVRLQGSILIPVNEVERRIGEIPKSRPVVVYCAVGSRSSLVAALLAQRGYREVYNITDGIVGWYRNGFPIGR